MQTITTKIQSSFNSTQMCKQCPKSMQIQHQEIQLEIQKLLPGFEMFLTNFSKFFSNSKFNLLYAENKLQSKNDQVVPNYQFRYKSFKHERGKSEFEIIFKFQ